MRLTPGELTVMRLLWEHGESTADRLMENHPEPIKNAALRSYLTILLDKGHVTRRREGRAYVYAAKTEKQRAMKSMIEQLADTFFQGSIRSLAMNLVSQESLSPEDIEQLRRCAAENDEETSK